MGGAPSRAAGYPYGSAIGVTVSEPVSTFRTWGVYRGPQRLSVPDFLAITGADQRRDELSREIKKARTASRWWFGFAGAGVTAIVTVIVGMSAAKKPPTYRQYNWVALGGTGVTISALMGASLSAGQGHEALSVSWRQHELRQGQHACPHLQRNPARKAGDSAIRGLAVGSWSDEVAEHLRTTPQNGSCLP